MLSLLALQALHKVYGNPQKLTSAYLKAHKAWSVIKYNDSKAFRKILRFLLKCQIIKKQGRPGYLDSIETLRTIITNFNSYMQSKLNTDSHNIMKSKDRDINFYDLVNFVAEQSSLESNPYFSYDAHSDGRERRTNIQTRAFSTQMSVGRNTSETEANSCCYYCESIEHKIDIFPKMKEMSIDGRQEVIKN